MLDGLPQWLGYLHDATVGQTRMGSGGRRTRGEPEGLHGDDLAPEGDTKLLDRFLALGGINARAARVRADVNATLVALVRHMEDTRGVVFEPQNRSQPEIDMARWLHAHVQSLALDEAAGEHYADVKGIIADIERVINRPVRRVWLGECPTWNEQHRRPCGLDLWAPENAVETRCARCRSTHSCDRLRLMQFNELERTKVPWERILKANKSQPEDRQIPSRTLQSWRAPGRDGQPPRLKIRGYQRPDGRHVINRHSPEDTPLYLWSDVRKLRDEKPQKVTTGSAAHKRNGNADKEMAG